MIATTATYVAAAVAEIAGCFAFWSWSRMDRSALWVLPGIASLIAFAYLLTRADSAFAGRAYAAYGGVFIVMSILWGWKIDGITPDRFDIVGGLIALVGVAVIMYWPRG